MRNADVWPDTAVVLPRAVPEADDAKDSMASRGLTSAEAIRRSRQDGPNVLPKPPSRPAWRVLGAQLVHFFALMLWCAAVLAAVAGMPQLGVAIFVSSSSTASSRSRRSTVPSAPPSACATSCLAGDGRSRRPPVEIDARELVVDDLVLLDAGDRISADMHAIEAHALADRHLDADRRERPGSRWTSARGAVRRDVRRRRRGPGGRQATGGNDSPGRDRRNSPAPASDRRARWPRAQPVVRTVALIAVGVGVAFFGISLALGSPAGDGFLFAIGVTVALVPEGLLPTVTLSLAVGAQRMARRNALVRRLESVETLGSTTFICTDKTGTLTRNEMAVVEVWTPAVRPRSKATATSRPARSHADPVRACGARASWPAAARCSKGRSSRSRRERDGRWAALGDPMEAALDAFARRLGIDSAADEVARRSGAASRSTRDAAGCRSWPAADCWSRARPTPSCRACQQTHGARPRRSMRWRTAGCASSPSRPAPSAWTSGYRSTRPDDAESSSRGSELLGLVGLRGPAPVRSGGAVAACRRARDRGRHGDRRPPGDGAGHRRRGRPARAGRARPRGPRPPRRRGGARRAPRPRRRGREPGRHPRTSCASPARCGPAGTSWP